MTAQSSPDTVLPPLDLILPGSEADCRVAKPCPQCSSLAFAEYLSSEIEITSQSVGEPPQYYHEDLGPVSEWNVDCCSFRRFLVRCLSEPSMLFGRASSKFQLAAPGFYTGIDAFIRNIDSHVLALRRTDVLEVRLLFILPLKISAVPWYEPNGPCIDYTRLNCWLKTCLRSHGPTCDVKHFRSIPGLRAIDCLNRKVVPCLSNQTYVTLSYVWGTSATKGGVVLAQLD